MWSFFGGKSTTRAAGKGVGGGATEQETCETWRWVGVTPPTNTQSPGQTFFDHFLYNISSSILEVYHKESWHPVLLKMSHKEYSIIKSTCLKGSCIGPCCSSIRLRLLYNVCSYFFPYVFRCFSYYVWALLFLYTFYCMYLLTPTPFYFITNICSISCSCSHTPRPFVDAISLPLDGSNRLHLTLSLTHSYWILGFVAKRFRYIFQSSAYNDL